MALKYSYRASQSNRDFLFWYSILSSVRKRHLAFWTQILKNHEHLGNQYFCYQQGKEYNRPRFSLYFSGHSFFLTWLWNHPIKSMIGYCSNSKPHTLVLLNWHYQIGNSVAKVDITFFRHAIHSIRDWQKKVQRRIFFSLLISSITICCLTLYSTKYFSTANAIIAKIIPTDSKTKSNVTVWKSMELKGSSVHSVLCLYWSS